MHILHWVTHCYCVAVRQTHQMHALTDTTVHGNKVENQHSVPLTIPFAHNNIQRGQKAVYKAWSSLRLHIHYHKSSFAFEW